MASDIKWARKKVLGATGEIDSLRGLRWMISDNQKYRVAGVVGFLKDIYSECQNLSEEDKQKSESLFCDNKNRAVYAFIGIVIDKYQTDSFGTIAIDYLWKVFLDRLYPIWNNTYQEVHLEPFSELSLDLIAEKTNRAPVRLGEKLFFESNPSEDYKLFSEYISREECDDFSFCSNISDFNMVKQSDFLIITTSDNNITRLSRANESKQSVIQNEDSLQTEPFIINNVSQNEPFEKKKYCRLEDLVNDIRNHYSDIIIDNDDGFGESYWTIEIRKLEREYHPGRSGQHAYTLIVKRRNSNG